MKTFAIFLITSMKTFVTILITALLACTSAHADDTTRRGKLRPRVTATVEPADTVHFDATEISADSLVISSYDKPLRSLRETFFVTNRHHHMSLASIRVRLTYRRHDNGTMLHARTVNISTMIPPGETRQLYSTSWDRQYSYYYYATRIKPRSAKAIAYDVDILPLSYTFER
jgi:hypothetical protein